MHRLGGPALLVLVAGATALPGLLLFSTNQGESLLGMYLLAASALVQLAAAGWAFWRRSPLYVAAGVILVVTAMLTLVPASYTCWVAGIEGECKVFG